MKEKKLSKFDWVLPIIIICYLIFLGVFLIYYQTRVHKLEKINEELYYELDDVLDEVAEEFARIERNIIELDKQINKLENELENAKEIYTEEDIRYAIDIFAEYLVEYPPNGTVCVYENGTLLSFKIVNDKLVFDEMLSYNDLKELWFNK